MKTLTLTHHSNCQEIEEFIKNKLTTKELIIGWNKGTNEAIRLECERLGSVVGGYVYEDAIYANSSDIQDKFPFDILNLDFSSQNPELEDGRLEKEICSIEHTVKLQANKGNNGMVLIYTTLLNSNPLNIEEIKRNSDKLMLEGQVGLSINELPSNIVDNQEKVKCLKEILKQVCSKYEYENIEDLNIEWKPLSDSSKYILSIVALLKRS